MRFLPYRRWLPVFLTGTGLSVSLMAAEPPPTAEASPYVAPLPGVVAFAEKEKIPLERVEIAADAAGARTGDSVTALITLFEGDHHRQWLLQITTLELTAKEQASKPPRPVVMFLSSGGKFTFEGARMALDLRLAGPFRDDAPTKPGTEKRVRAIVNPEFLGLGFDRAAATAMRLTAAAKANPTQKDIGFNFSTKPFPPEVTAKGRALATTLGLTADDERSFAGFSPALLAFFDLAQKTPGLQEILAEILDKASLAWSALTHGGKIEPAFMIIANGVSQIDAENWGSNLPPSYQFPFQVSLNQKLALLCQLVVTAPRPPLLTSAGIMGIIVQQPKDKTKTLIIRVLAARRAPPGAQPQAPGQNP